MKMLAFAHLGRMPRQIMALVGSIAASIVLTVASAPSAMALLLDPTNLHMTDSPAVCATCNADPIAIAPTSTLDISLTSGGQTIEADQLLLLLAVPTQVSFTDTISGPSNSSLAYSVLTSFTSSSYKPDTIYAAAGLTNGQTASSPSFTNFVNAESAYNPSIRTVTDFNVYVYQIDQGLTKNSSPVGVTFKSTLPAGVIALAYGCVYKDTLGGTASNDFGGGCINSSGSATNPEDTAWTTTDLITNYNKPYRPAGLPDPQSLLLVATGLLILGVSVRRRRRSV